MGHKNPNISERHMKETFIYGPLTKELIPKILYERVILSIRTLKFQAVGRPIFLHKPKCEAQEENNIRPRAGIGSLVSESTISARQFALNSKLFFFVPWKKKLKLFFKKIVEN